MIVGSSGVAEAWGQHALELPDVKVSVLLEQPEHCEVQHPREWADTRDDEVKGSRAPQARWSKIVESSVGRGPMSHLQPS